MLSGVLTPDCLLDVAKGNGVRPLATPPRRVLLVVDTVLAAVILWLLLSPSSSSVGPTVGYSEPNLDEMLRLQAKATAATGELPRPWSINTTRHRTTGRRRTHGSKRHRRHRRHRTLMMNATSVTAAETHGCSATRQSVSCLKDSRRVVVTLSIGKRSHFAVTRIPMEAYAKRVNAEFAVVDSLAHKALAGWNDTLRTDANSHFMKLPLLQWFLARFDQVVCGDTTSLHGMDCA